MRLSYSNRTWQAFGAIAGCLVLLLLGACSSRCAPGYVLVNGLCQPASTKASAQNTAGTGESPADSKVTDAGSSTRPATNAEPTTDADSSAGHSAGAAGRTGQNAAKGGKAGTAAPVSTGVSGAGAPEANMPSGPCAGQTEAAVCDGAVMVHCNGAASEGVSETCMTEALCQLGVAGGACALCMPGTFECDGVLLKRCSDVGQWEELQTCDSVALCNATTGACTDMVCKPSQKTCDASGKLLTCNDDGSDFASEERCGAGLCDADSGRCNRCVPNAKMCSGTMAVSCSADGQNTSMTPCTAPSGDCATSTCRAGECVAGMKSAGSACTAGGGKLCDASGRCVRCLRDSDCPGQFDVCMDGSCVEGPGCGNGELDPGEVCEVAGPNAYAPGTCNRMTCGLEDAAYAACKVGTSSGAGMCGVNSSQGWFCGASGACSHVCGFADQCKTTSGKGDCVGNGGADKFCVIRCSTPGSSSGCPSGLTCINGAPAGLPNICGSML